jgi:organic radical activating enzyme
MEKKLADISLEKNADGTIMHTDENKHKVLNLLDATGKGFCLAKWTQVTMHLGSGLTHSCHHPVPHKIPLDELEKNPSALHNTTFKKEQRTIMLNGGKPAECDFCWRIEDNTKEFSDRTLKSIAPYSLLDHDAITSMNGSEDVYPRYVEVSFSSVCNLKCSYCGPTHSSKWAEEIANHGPYKLTEGDWYHNNADGNILAKDDNPYTTAFWKWFPGALPHLHTFRVTGGEPLMSKHTFMVMEYLLDNPQPNLEFAVNSNASVPDKLWARFVDLAIKLEEQKCIKKLTLFVSAEGTKQQLEYSRFGMSWDAFTHNVENFLSLTTNTRVVFMCAFNVFSLPSFKEQLEYTLYLKKRFVKSGTFDWISNIGVNINDILNSRVQEVTNEYAIDYLADTKTTEPRVGIDIPYVRYPDFLDVKILPLSVIEKYLLPAVDYMYKNVGNNNWDSGIGFAGSEADKLKRILVDCLSRFKHIKDTGSADPDVTVAILRSRFYEFVTEYDKRRHVSFIETFPEYSDFYNLCAESNFKRGKVINVIPSA